MADEEGNAQVRLYWTILKNEKNNNLRTVRYYGQLS